MDDIEIGKIRAAYAEVVDNIGIAARLVGRDPQEVKIVVVSKSQPPAKIRSAIEAGIRLFGENYPEETQEKITTAQPPGDVQWHMIGHVQSRKIKIIAAHFNLLQSLDSVRLAEKLNSYLQANQHDAFPVLLEFNVSGEDSKHGFPAWDDIVYKETIRDLEQIMQMEYIHILGVMGMPPLFKDPERSRPFHRRLYNISTQLQRSYPNQSWQEVSTGTSYDYQVAVQEGATYVRVGQAIMGERPRG